MTTITSWMNELNAVAEPQITPLICSGYDATLGPCRRIIDPARSYLRHKVTGNLLCLECKRKMELHSVKDWVQK